jgi:hypothetical protein
MEDKKFAGVLKRAVSSWQEGLGARAASHPPEELVAAFAEGRLQGKDMTEVMAHLCVCDLCLAGYAAAQGAIHEPLVQVPEALRQRLDALARDPSAAGFVPKAFHIAILLKEKAFELLSATGDVLVGQEYVPGALVRGKHQGDFPDTLVVVKDMERVRMSIKCEVRGGKDLALTVEVTEKETARPCAHARISLWREGVELESLASDRGAVSFEHVGAARYNVRAEAPAGTLAGEVSLEIRE